MTHSDREDRRTLGPTGVVGFAADTRLAEAERRAMRDNAAHILENASDADALFDRLVLAANWLKGWQRIDRESSVAGREGALRPKLRHLRLAARSL